MFLRACPIPPRNNSIVYIQANLYIEVRHKVRRKHIKFLSYLPCTIVTWVEKSSAWALYGDFTCDDILIFLFPLCILAQ